jgi:hypothetical protein
MEATVHKAFDLVVTKIFFPAGSVNTIDPIIDNIFQVGTSFEYIWLHTKGRAVATETTTGEVIEREKNDCTSTKPYPRGEWKINFVEDLEILCLSPFMNESKKPLHNKVSPFVLLSNQSLEIPKDSKLFLGVGSIKINEKTINAPAQIHFSSEIKTVQANVDSYGFFVT